MKNECTRRLVVPYGRYTFWHELALYVDWYNCHRPHQALDGATPKELYDDLLPACRGPRFEPRKKWPRGSPCAGPVAEVRGRRGTRLAMRVSYVGGRRHLPIVELQRAT